MFFARAFLVSGPPPTTCQRRAAASTAVSRRTRPAPLEHVPAQERQSRRLFSTSTTTTTTATTKINGTTSPISSSSSSSSSTAAVELRHTDFSSTTEPTTTKRPPALFLHGLLGNKRNFASIARSLSQQLERPRRIVGLDLRNHGDNHHDWRDDMSYSAMAADVLHFCDRHQLEQVELIGHSVGGKVAQALALMAPERVSGLVVLDIAPVAYRADEPHWKAVQDIIDTLCRVDLSSSSSCSKRDIDRQLRSQIPDPALRAFVLTNLDEKNGKWKIHLESIADQLDALARFDVATMANADTDDDQQKHQYHGDSFFIHGGQSRFVRHSHLETIGEYFPNHMLTTIRGSGHWVHAEAPEDTTALLKRFLDR